MPRTIHVNSKEEFDKHIYAKGSFGQAAGVVVDYTATWCGPCKMIGPIFDSLSDEFPSITFLKVDVDDLSDVAAASGVKAMPTFQSFLAGAKEDELVGADKNKLKALIETLAGKVGGGAGAGHKLGVGAAGSSATAVAPTDDSPEARRARALAAAEARLKGAAAKESESLHS